MDEKTQCRFTIPMKDFVPYAQKIEKKIAKEEKKAELKKRKEYEFGR